MQKNKAILIALVPLIMVLCSWGFFAHQKIGRIAVFTLPTELIGFYKSNIDYITEHSVDPDKRRYVDSLEAPRHYFDADHYGVSPFDSIPRKWDDAVKKYSEDTLRSFGTVPWQIQLTYYKLVKAFEARDSSKILKHSADLCHYIADAHVPLHTSENYNGQLTGQVGIHGFWESRLPELFADKYDFYVGRAKYIDKPLDAAWDIVEDTFTMLDSVLTIEKKLSKGFASDRKYTYNERNNKVVKEYSLEYSEAYHNALNGMVEKQMRKAILATGSFWFSAWVDAGQPDMKKLIRTGQSAGEKRKVDEEEALYQKGKILGRPELGL